MSAPRLLLLYLRARRTGVALACLLGGAALTWLLLDHTSDPLLVKLTLIILPLAPAAIIGVALRSPFGEAERSAGSSLPALRGCHLVGLLLVAGLALAVAHRAATGPDFDWLLVRNAAGYCGLALLGGRLSGAALSWLTPFLYGLFATVAPGGFLPRESRWLWPIQPPDVYAAAIIACVLLAVGLLVGIVYGARPVADEQG